MTDLEFQNLMKLQKIFIKDSIKLPLNGKKDTYDLKSIETNDKFYLDVDRRGRLELVKFKLQNRYAITKLPLIRIDIDSPPHLNPDGTKTSRNHIHIYKELVNDTGNLPWAYDLKDFDGINFNENNINFMEIFISFCEYCNIKLENIQGVI